jgi:hypothetical protein
MASNTDNNSSELLHKNNPIITENIDTPNDEHIENKTEMTSKLPMKLSWTDLSYSVEITNK